MQYDRRAFTAGMASLLLCPVSLDLAHGQQLERSSLKLGVANKSHLYYLPVTIAERRGHFRDYGLTINVSDFEGGGQAFDALLAGSVTARAAAFGIPAATHDGMDPQVVLEATAAAYPIRQNLKPCWYIIMTIVSVLLSGPPPVMTYGSAKI